MSLRSHLFFGTVALALVSVAVPCRIFAQQPETTPLESAVVLPEAPQPQFAVPAAQEPSPQPQPNPPQPAPANPPAQSSSSSQAPVPETPGEKAQREKAEEQIKEQERQRVLGVVPNFNITYRNDAVSLTAAEKLKLAFHSATDPVTFGVAFVVAGYGEVADSDSGFPWGPKGYFERAGSKYLDAFDGTMIGNGILPAIFHQDPRYFRLGHGSKTHRLLYAMSTTVICKHDKSNRWEPNYSNVVGNLASGAISNFYYPGNNSDIGLTISNGMIVTAEGTLGGVFDEFWPDISRKLFHKDPTHGLDAQARAADAAKKPSEKNKKQQPLPPSPK